MGMRNCNSKNVTHNHLLKSHHGCNLRCIWLYELSQKQPRVEFSQDSLILFLLQHSPCFNPGINNLFNWSQSLNIQSFLPASIPAQTICFTSLSSCIDNIPNCFNAQINNLSSEAFYIPVLTFSLLQPWHKQPFLLVSITRQTIFLTCFNPWIDNLVCNFSTFIPVKISPRDMTINFCSLFM